MASIDKRPDGRYRARWREYPGGPQKTRQFARKGDADRFLDAIRGDLAYGVYVDLAGRRAPCSRTTPSSGGPARSTAPARPAGTAAVFHLRNRRQVHSFLKAVGAS